MACRSSARPYGRTTIPHPPRRRNSARSGPCRDRFFRESAKPRLPASDREPHWSGPTGRIAKFIVEQADTTLDAYRAQPRLVTEHANHEHDMAHGGHAHRQPFELVRNSADALIEAPGGKSILIRLTDGFLYCADDGNPIDERGIDTQPWGYR